MAGSDDDDESDEALKAELTAARDSLRRQIEIIDMGPMRRRSGEDGPLRADLADQLQQVETELAKYADQAAPAEDGEQAPVESEPESEPEAEPQPGPEPEEIATKPAASAPVQFHTDAPDGPPTGGQFWTFAGMGVIGLLVLGLLLRVFSVLLAHVMGHPAS